MNGLNLDQLLHDLEVAKMSEEDIEKEAKGIAALFRDKEKERLEKDTSRDDAPPTEGG